MKNLSKLTSPLLLIAIGLLLLVFKGGIVSIALTVFGVVFIVMGIVGLINKQNQTAIIRLIIGAVIIAFGWLFVQIALYIIAFILILTGVYLLFNLVSKKIKFSLVYLNPLLLFVAGICLFFNQGVTMDWVFIVVGAVFVVQGVLGAYGMLKK